MIWENFTQRILINADKDILYNAFATRGGMESWFLRTCEYTREEEILTFDDQVKEGDKYKFLWHGWSDETVEYGSIIAANGVDSLEFTFDGNGVTNMKVKITIEPLENGNMVTLFQYDIPTDDESKYNWHLGCKTGWNFYLTNLKAIVEHNVDLRNRDENLIKVLNS